ncbi:MAG: uncharacterized protein QG604_83 [Candidatus Dependentiae bacterium]|nr:uncharacterized protein [Candidatus Dependentiae bacterium]
MPRLLHYLRRHKKQRSRAINTLTLAKHLACAAVITCFLSNTLGAWVHQASTGVAVVGAGSAAYYANEWRQAKKELDVLVAAEKLHGPNTAKGMVLRKLIAARKKCAISSLVALLAALAAWRSRGEKESPSVDRSSAMDQPKGIASKKEFGAIDTLVSPEEKPGNTTVLAEIPPKEMPVEDDGFSSVLEAPVPLEERPGGATALEITPPEEAPTAISDNANLEERNRMDLAALVRAARDGNAGEAQRLIKAGADINARDQNGMTALIWAAANRHVEIVEMLLDKGADVDADSVAGTALMWAAQQGYVDVIKILLARGANVNAKGVDSATALQRTTWYSSEGSSPVAVAKILLDNGADINATDAEGRTVLTNAQRRGRSADLIALLEAAGAK